jgi:hypothetical protein
MSPIRREHGHIRMRINGARSGELSVKNSLKVMKESGFTANSLASTP